MPTSPSGPSLAVTLGDPAGIGPEVTLKALAAWGKNSKAKILLLGKASFFAGLAREMGIQFDPARFCCYFPWNFPKKVCRGHADPALTTLAVRSIELGVKLAMEGRVDAIVTPPINKAALKKAGFKIPGHTEYLAKLSKTKRFEMMLVGGPLRVVLTTRHVPLKEVSKNLSKKTIEDAILLTAEELRRSFGIQKPRIVVCSLNPHAGEEGNLGSEEIKIISPAVRCAQKKTKARITGPLSSDVLFREAYRGLYDAQICMYHDQGQIPLKMISRGAGVNVTLGLPFVRTSPDHGTGYDIANKFTADPGSMTEALTLATVLCRNRKTYDAYRRS